ncbi:MAG: hypothetical protein GXP51_12500 [Deltaproteobacteria bacterium]|nr:hypothetical protein [Deltaproteobacteria bacterium]
MNHRFLLSFYSFAVAVLFAGLLPAPTVAAGQTGFPRSVIKKAGRCFAAVPSFESADESADSLPPSSTGLPQRQRPTALPSVFPQSHTEIIQPLLNFHLSRPPPVPSLS